MATPLDLAAKTAIVTGGATGIGAATAIALARAGADVVITYHSHDPSDVIKQIHDLGRVGVAFALESADSADVHAVVSQAVDALGGYLDILVNNAGGLIGRCAIAEMSDEHWHRVIDVNLSSTFYTIRSSLPFLRDGGRIINISSLAAENGGGTGSAAYATSKAGQLGLTRALAKELAPRAITVNAIAPGFIPGTPFHDTFTSPENQRASQAGIPLPRVGTPEDVAGAVLYLASELSQFSTGTTLDLNGGVYFA